jgi:SAM-dependent methyltransferase
MPANQVSIWEDVWRQQELNPEKILYSRFAREAYMCISKFIETKDKLILEAGCGTGRLCCLLAKHLSCSQIIGMDTSETSLYIANSLKDGLGISNVLFRKGNLFQIPYPDNYFDAVFNEGVIEHYKLDNHPNYIDALAEMIRVTKRGGKVIVAVPNWYNFPHTLYKWILKKLGKNYIYDYEKSFRHSELIDLFLNGGLRKIEITGFYPAHGFQRLSGKRLLRVFSFLGLITDIGCILGDSLFHNYFSYRFGIEIVGRGIKP